MTSGGRQPHPRARSDVGRAPAPPEGTVKVLSLRPALLLSLGVHGALVALAIFGLSKVRVPEKPKPEFRVDWQGELPGSGQGQGGRNAPGSGARLKSPGPRVHGGSESVSKLFRLPELPGLVGSLPGGGDVEGRMVTGRVARGSWDGKPGVGGVHILVEGEDLPVLNRVADRLQEILAFPPDLMRLHPAGIAKVSFMADGRGGLLSASLRSQQGDRFLKVHLLNTLLGGLLVADMGAKMSPVKITAFFSSGMKNVTDADQLPRIINREIEVIRHRKNAELRLGEEKFSASSPEDGNTMLGLTGSFELESLFDADHRREFGWRGDKKTSQESRLFRKRYESLERVYKARGYLS